MKISAIIVAAGRGLRFLKQKKSSGKQSRVLKQFVLLKGIPVFIRSLKPFENCSLIDEIVFVAPKGKKDYCKKIILKNGFKKISKIVEGGDRRQDSVLNGLMSIESKSSDIVLVHDGARPFVEEVLIKNCIAAVKKYGAAVVGMPMTDTIKQVQKGFVTKTLDRNVLYSVQTPQGFRYGIFLKAYKLANKYRIFASDDTYIVEKSGVSVKIVEGSAGNIKITTPMDLLNAENMLGKK